MASAAHAIRRAFNSVTQAYREINPATLSGAIDIIVVEQEGADGEKTLACSPFHVRFGKLTVLRPVDRKVRVKINGEQIPFEMRVGETGEAYFVFETEGPVPEHLIASPLSEAAPDETLGENQEVEPFELGPSQTSGGAAESDGESHVTATSGSVGQLSEPSDAETTATSVNDERFGADDKRHHLRGRMSDGEEKPANAGVLRGAAEKASQLGRIAIDKAKDGSKLTSYFDGLKKSDDAENDALKQEVDALESEMRTSAGALQDADAQDRPTTTVSAREANTIGDEVRADARRKIETLEDRPSIDVRVDLPPQSTDDVAETRTGSTAVQNVRFDGRGPDIGPLPETSGDLVLDMGGYKMKDKDVGKVKETTDALLSSEIGVSQEASGPLGAGDELLAFTQSLLRSAELERTRSGSQQLEAVISSTESDEAELSTSPSSGTSTVRPPSPSPSEAEIISAGVLSSPSPYQICLRAEDIAHVFELSVCGSDDFGIDRRTDDSTFESRRVSLQQIREEPELLNRTDVVLRYNERYLTWETASPVFFALVRYFQAISHESRHLDRGAVDPKLAAVAAAAQPRSWSRWWTRGRSDSLADPAGATVSDHASIRSEQPPRKRTASPAPMTKEEEEGQPDAGVQSVGTHHRAATAPPEIHEEHETDQKLLLTPPLESAGLEGRKNYAKTLRLSSDQLKALNLKKGLNDISFTVLSSYSGIARCTARIFFWETDHQVVISDIDGTITKSDALGHVFTMIGRDWTHLGVAKLYTDIARNGYKLLYLTSRAVGQADTTREYLKGISQNGYQLPEGPVIMSPDRLMTSLHREVIMRKPEVFKMACLRDIAHLFKARNPFYAGFGNRITDALSYRSVDVPSSRIFTIDSYGEVKLELLELAGYKASYIAINDLVDQMFPPINRKAAPEFTDFSYWRAPLPQVDFPDLAPPSPALSARSDGSMSRLRRLSNFSNPLGRKASASSMRDGAASPRAASPRPTSPLMQPAMRIDEDDEELDALEKLERPPQQRRRARQTSESMPGSFEEESFFDQAMAGKTFDEPEDLESQPGVKATREEEEEDELLAAGQMDDLDFSSVPY